MAKDDKKPAPDVSEPEEQKNETGVAETAESEPAPEASAPQEKTVKLRLTKTKELKEPVWVRVNERKWLIQRGVEVEVPECVFEVLKHSEEMQEIIMAFEEANIKE